MLFDRQKLLPNNTELDNMKSEYKWRRICTYQCPYRAARDRFALEFEIMKYFATKRLRAVR
jgi:hypothetical protein